MSIMSRRYCGNCAHFRGSLEGRGSCFKAFGWCGNPARQVNSGIPIPVRPFELPCRYTWDEDLWEQGNDSTQPQISVRDMIVWSPISASTALDDYPDDLLDLLIAFSSDDTIDLRDLLGSH